VGYTDFCCIVPKVTDFPLVISGISGPILIKFAEYVANLTSQAAQSRQPCVNSHWLSLWETCIFDPPQNRRPL